MKSPGDGATVGSLSGLRRAAGERELVVEPPPVRREARQGAGGARLGLGGAVQARLFGLCLLVLGVGSAGCAGVNRQPPGKPPSEATISKAEPGGDAHDPHRAALQRLLDSPWGSRNDKDDQIHAPTPDWQHWKRVRFWGVSHFTGFRYGDDHHALGVVFVQKTPEGKKNDSRSCLARFEAWAWPKVKSFEVELSPFRTKRREFRGEPLLVKQVDGSVTVGLARHVFSAAWTAYPNVYPDACLIYAVAIPWKNNEALAKRLRDRWVLEGFQRMRPLTEQAPVRK